MTGTRQGGCRCGRARFEVSGPTLLTLACHCVGCQHMTGSAFSLSEGHSTDAFKLLSGELVPGGLQTEHRHHYCAFCKGWLYTEPSGVDGYINVRATQFDEPLRDPPFVEVHVAEALPWARTHAVHSFETLPAMERWPELIDQYMRGAGAPSDQQGLPA